MSMRGKTIIIVAALLAGTLGLAPAGITAPVFTNTSADFWGQQAGLLRLRPGDIVTAYDPQGVLCGRCVVKQKGLYGFLHVYGDDPDTPRDEGARPGDARSRTPPVPWAKSPKPGGSSVAC